MAVLTAVISVLGTASAAVSTVDDALAVIDGIVANEFGNSPDVSKVLKENIGATSEWYAMALSKLGTYELSGYRDELLEYLGSNEITSPSSREKFALTLIACGSDDPFIEKALSDSVGMQGIMSYVFGLHIINNGYECETATQDTVISQILSMQLEDGGWAVMGNNGDVDVTAMVLQSLAPYKNENKVSAAIDAALVFLSAQQSENGDFASYGVFNAESTAQVLTALSCLGIDQNADMRFRKGENTVLDGLLRYRLKSGTFSHDGSDTSNGTATVQAFYSAVSYICMKEGKGSLYIFESDKDSPAFDSTDENTSVSDETENEAENFLGAYRGKLIACVTIILLAVIASTVLFITKRRNPKNHLIIFTVTAALLVAVVLIKFESADNYYGSAPATIEDPIGEVTLLIRCDTVIGRRDDIPESGDILSESLGIENGDTVRDVLIRAAREHGLHIDAAGGKNYYVRAIENISEFDFGDLSGWMYRVNGEFPSVGCSEYVLRDNDRIEWLYTTDMGEDLK